MPDPAPENQYDYIFNNQEVYIDQNTFVKTDDLDALLQSLQQDPDADETGGAGFDPEADDTPVNSLPPVALEQLGPARYTDSSIDGNIEWDMGIVVMPVCGPIGTPPVLIQCYSPVACRAAEFSIGRCKEKPRLPLSFTGNPNEVVISKSIQTSTPNMDSRGNLLWRGGGRYEYVFIKPPTLRDRLPVGVPPYSVYNTTIMSLGPEDFDGAQLDNTGLAVTDLTLVSDSLFTEGFSKIDLVGP